MQNYIIPAEISWLSFNSCILDEADDINNALYERIKFLAIHSSNLDEFFRVKINKLLRKKTKKNTELLDEILTEVNLQQNRFGTIWNNSILPELAANNIIYYENQEILLEHLREMEYFFKSIILSYIQVIYISENSRKSYYLNNRGLYLLVKFKDLSGKYNYAYLNIPSDKIDRYKQLQTIENINYKSIGRYKNGLENSTIVFLHDSLGCVQLWRDFPDQISKFTNCNVLVYDRCGYGKSTAMTTSLRPKNYLEIEADILNQLLSILELDNIILFGHSDGGSISLLMASKYPERIRGLICEAGHIFVEDITLKGIDDAIESYVTTNLPSRLTKYHGEKVDMIFATWTDTWKRINYRDWNIECFLHRITCPVLFIQGTADEYGTLAQVETTLNLVKGRTEKYILPEIGH
ncbi:MAG: alpha/beta fold hydrolase, partial [Flavobacterium sp.]